jgi:hypothetical protein
MSARAKYQSDIHIRISDDEERAWKAAADADERPVSAWARRLLNHAAEKAKARRAIATVRK